MFSNYKRFFFSPYKRSDFPAIIFTFLIIFGLFFTVFTLRQDSNIRSNAQSVNSVEPENGTLAGNVNIVSDANASGGKYVRFGNILTVTPTPVSAWWTGDFETCDLSQWQDAQRYSTDRIQIVGPGKTYTSPVGQGACSARFEVHPGEYLGNYTGGVRAEVLTDITNAHASEGQDTYYHWKTYLPTDFPAIEAGKWEVIAQWHSILLDGSPPLEMTMQNQGGVEIFRLDGGWNLGGDGGTETHLKVAWIGSVVKGSWVDFVVHVKWTASGGASNPAGFVEVWRDGAVQALENGSTRMPFKTLYTDPNTGLGYPNYLKQGLYRSPDYNNIGILFQDAMKVGPTYDSVQ